VLLLEGHTLAHGMAVIGTNTDELIVPVAGVYQVDAAIATSTASNAVTVGVQHNGTKVLGYGSYSQAASGLVVCAAGDSLELTAYNATGAPVTVVAGPQNGTFLHAFLVST
jgi:hypothetical protein